MSYGGRDYGGVRNQQNQNQEWLEKMKADRQAGTGAYAIKQGGPNVAQYPNQQQMSQVQYQDPSTMSAPDRMGRRPPGSGIYKHPSGAYYDEYGNKMSVMAPYGGQPQTDPYQLPQKPQFSSVNGVGMNPGQPQISTVGPRNAYDLAPNSPRPQQPPLAPGQHPYNGPAIKPMNNQPGKGIGLGGPTVFNQNFAQSPYGQSQFGGPMQQGQNPNLNITGVDFMKPQNPYQPKKNGFGQQPNSQWGY